MTVQKQCRSVWNLPEFSESNLYLKHHLKLQRKHRCQQFLTWLLVFQNLKNPPVNARDTGDASSVNGLGRSPGEGNDNPLQNSCLEKPTDRGVGYAVHGVTKSWTQLKRLSTHTYIYPLHLETSPQPRPHPSTKLSSLCYRAGSY